MRHDEPARAELRAYQAAYRGRDGGTGNGRMRVSLPFRPSSHARRLHERPASTPHHQPVVTRNRNQTVSGKCRRRGGVERNGVAAELESHHERREAVAPIGSR